LAREVMLHRFTRSYGQPIQMTDTLSKTIGSETPGSKTPGSKSPGSKTQVSKKSRFGHPVYRFETIDTTMKEAAARAENGEPEGTLIVADQQTSGRGRLGRAWVSEPAVGLYFSLVLRPPAAAARSSVLTLALGLGVARGIGEACGVQCDIRWPNDVLLNDKKCCGILVESVAESGSLRYAIAGIGINVNQAAMPPELADIATSLRMETGCEYLRETVLEAVLKHCERYYEMFIERGAQPVVEAFSRTSSYVRGKTVVVELGDSRIYGTTAGLDPSGVLLLKREDGSIEAILAGSVRPWTKSGEEGL
jgi:BirA family biotin operon repressor/biotin-[acetyl-CoA-carboxylase] ligase